MKRKLAAVLSALMLLGALAGCGTKHYASSGNAYASYGNAYASSGNAYASYGPGTATKAGDPSAAEWQAANKDALAKATSDDELICFVRDGASARALLAKVKPNYGTDPLVASQIAAISQFVMRPGWENARGVWADALFDSFRTATDDTVRMAYLEQLRWCGNKKHALAIQVVASTSPSRAVRDFANVVVRELSR